MTTAPDGTIYKLGGGQTGLSALGSEPGPYFLWQHPPGGGEWNPIDYVYSYAVAPDSRLYILDASRNLRTPALGPARWATLATDVQSFQLGKDGTLFVLNAAHELRTRLPGSQDWSTTEAGVRSLMMTPEGTVWTITDSLDLRQRTAGNRWTVMDRGVQSFAMVSDGTLYELNGKGQLKRLKERGASTVLATGVESFQVAPAGGVYALNGQHELMKLTARDHWTVLDRGVVKFQIAPNGDLYLINDHHELRRQKAGYSWMTLQTNAESFTIYSDGTVYAFDSHQKPTLYSSLGPYFVLDPVPPGYKPIANAPPSPGEIVAAANLRSPSQSFASHDRVLVDFYISDVDQPPQSTDARGPGHTPAVPPVLRASSTEFAIPDQLVVQDVSIVVEITLDQVDPARFVAGLGAAQLHRAQYKCTIYYTTEENVQEQLTLYIDHDHYHRL